MGLLDLLFGCKKEDISPKPHECIQENVPKKPKVIFEKEFLIVGEKFECRKNSKKRRSDVIKKMNLNSPVRVEKYTYQGSPAYMIVDIKSNLDLGVLSSGAASWLSDYYSKGKVDAILTDKYKNSFHVNIIVYK